MTYNILRPLQAFEFPSIRRELISRYARDQITAGRWPADSAHEQAEAELSRLLPQGLETPSHVFHAIIHQHADEAIGWLWVKLSDQGNAKEAFLCDIHIRASSRRQGHARRALIEMESLLRGQNMSSIGLHAFSHNAGAIALYEALGYRTTSVNMHKQLN